MYSSSLLLGFCLVIGLVQATAYNLQDDYTSDGNFFDKFDFFTGPDPTEGWVDFLTYDNATSSGLIKSTNPPSWGADSSNVISPSNAAGRPSIRLTSQKTYNHGLFILDLAHMPYSACGVWPAFWSFSQSASWPVGGEIDIIEYVNNHKSDLMTLHTSDGCSINGDSSTMTGEVSTTVCDVSQGNGCSINNTNSNAAGTGFDNNGGGVYAMEWTSELIQVWFFPKGSVPSSITSGTPDTSSFGEPAALFTGGGCNIDNHFYDHALIFDLTFCGSWAGTSFQSDGCPMTTGDSASSCIAYVGNNPAAYEYAYWTVNSLKVYTMSTASSGATSSTSSSLAARSTPETATSTSFSTSITSSANSTMETATSATSSSNTSAAQTGSSASGWAHPHHSHPPSRRHVHHGRNQLDW